MWKSSRKSSQKFRIVSKKCQVRKGLARLAGNYSDFTLTQRDSERMETCQIQMECIFCAGDGT